MSYGLKIHSCCFIGHRKIITTDKLINVLRNNVEDLITCKNVDTFLFGSKSEFNDLCYMIVSNFKEKYSHIKRIYVRAKYPYIDNNYKQYILQSYEDTYYSHNLINAGKSVYIKRNYEMIDNSNFCIIYYDENYLPKKKNYNQNSIGYKSKSGTKIAFDYAKTKGINIINILDFKVF